MMRTLFCRAIWVQFLVIWTLGFAYAADSLRIAAASDLKFTLDEVIHKFEEKYPGSSVQVSYGSSGGFVAQISQKAPFDLFMAADSSYIDPLIQKGLADPPQKFYYALGKLVLWIPRSSEVNLVKFGMRSLLSPQVRKVAIANPQHAPYGRAAETAMKSAHVYDQVKEKLVLGENVAQAAQFVQSETAQMGIIALSLAKSEELEKAGKYWVVPSELYPKLEQAGIILKRAKNLPVATQFRDFVLSPDGKKVFKKYGFSFPEK